MLTDIMEIFENMEKDFFCLKCGAQKKGLNEGDLFEDFCSKCGESTYFSEHPEIWICIGEGDKKELFVLINDNSNNTWVELYKNEKEFKKLVNGLAKQEDVRIIEGNNNKYMFRYSRNGYIFEISFISYVHYLIDPWWDGEEFVTFAFVEKNHPDFEAYKQELSRVCLILNSEIQTADSLEESSDLTEEACSDSSDSSSKDKADNIILPLPKVAEVVKPKKVGNDYAKAPICSHCKSKNVHLCNIAENNKSMKNKMAFGSFAVVMIFMFVLAFLGNEKNMLMPLFLGVFWGLPISLIVRAIPWKALNKGKPRFICNDCGRKF